MFPSLLSQFGSAIFSSKEGGASHFVHIMNVQVIGVVRVTHNCRFSLFFLDKKCVYSVAECLYDHINSETFQMRE